MMKHIYLILLSCVVWGCSLEEEARDQITEEQAFTNASDLYLNTVATLYNYVGGNTDGQGLQGTCRGVYDLQTFGSDEALLPTRGVDWYDGGIWQAMYKHSWSAGHELPKNAWLYLYKVITLCNYSLEKLEEHQKMAGPMNYLIWTSEVRALRAMYYWYLIDLFGDVPLITSSVMDMNRVTREKRSVVFEFIMKEMDVAIHQLSPSNSVREGDYYGRITMPVCYFVMAKMMLNSGVYLGTTDVAQYMEQCIEYCDEIEALGYELESHYSNNFIVYNENSKENIFIIPMDKHLYSNLQQNIHRSYHYRHAAAYGFTGENGTCATLQALKMYGYGTDELDHRFHMNFYYGAVNDLNGDPVLDRTGQQLVYYPDKVEMDLSFSDYLETAGARMKKYEVDKVASKDGKLMDNDIVLFRFADVLLMRAEAYLRLGKASKGQDDFDLVRDRARMKPVELTMENLERERFVELCWEGWRRQDMIRFGHYKSLFQGEDGDEPVDESDGHTTVFPIPADVRALNQNLTQNKGY